MLDNFKTILESITTENMDKHDYREEIREAIQGESIASLDRSSAIYEDLEGNILFDGDCKLDHGLHYHITLEFDLDGNEIKEPYIEIRDVWFGGLVTSLCLRDRVIVMDKIREVVKR